MMLDKESVKAKLLEAFAAVEYPGDWCLCGSHEGDEPYLLENEFRGKTDWRLLDPGFLDQAPAGLGSALSFFSDEAFRFYLPGYLLADLDGQLQRADPLFHLCHGLDEESRGRLVNAQRYGQRTWFDVAQYKFAVFSSAQAAAIVAYLRYKLQSDDLVDFERQSVLHALCNYWLQRAVESSR